MSRKSVSRYQPVKRDAALWHVRSLTRWLIAGSVGAAAGLVVVAAHETPGHKASSSNAGTATQGSSTQGSTGSSDQSSSNNSLSQPQYTPSQTVQPPQATTGQS